MKKFITVIIALIALCSCEPETRTKIYTTDGTSLYVRKFEYDGHRYIEFARLGLATYDNYTGYVHDPDCPCHENK